ncbi:hypothetical protein K438DRAFT_1826775 [Mycena galopus ATCC 62051]|nr:hypothetical protein K438DRAFT_1826775 [Mycena galopus ATCC 62051]
MRGLQTLPTELIEAIYIQLDDALSLVRLSQVSRQLRLIFQCSSTLQYKVQLKLAGLCDGFGNAGSAARLDLLKAYQTAWSSFACTRNTKTTVNMGDSYWELVGNVLATYNTESGFVFTRIPCALRQVPHVEWSVDDVPFPVNDFSMDLSQNLLLVVEVTSSGSTVVHLLSLNTGRPHPLARNAHLAGDDNAPGPSSPSHFEIRVFGDYVGLMVEDAELLVWEWKTGVLKKDLCGNEMTSFAFLNHRTILVSVLVGYQPELRVLDIEGSQIDMSEHFSFRLPALSRGTAQVTRVKMSIQTEPPPSWTAEPHPAEPFTTCHSDRLFVVSLGWSESGPKFLLCVRLSPLLNLMENPPEDSRTVAWDAWGPSNTRALQVAYLPDPWVCFVYGQRCVIQTAQTRCQILDFNPLTTRQQTLGEKRVDTRRRMFEQPVTTSAPFALHSVDIPPSAAVMLAEDGIVTVSPDEDLFTIFAV